MTEPSTQERIRRSASRLFHELGYSGVTIRGVADDAGVSPALVMKLFGSKAALYAASTPEVGMPSTENVLFDDLGNYLVSRVVARIRTGENDPWAQAVFLTWQSPDPDVERRRFVEQVVTHVLRHLPDDEDGRARAHAASCQLIGLALGMWTLGLRDDASPAAQDAFVERYGALVQASLEGRTA